MGAFRRWWCRMNVCRLLGSAPAEGRSLCRTNCGKRSYELEALTIRVQVPVRIVYTCLVPRAPACPDLEIMTTAMRTPLATAPTNAHTIDSVFQPWSLVAPKSVLQHGLLTPADTANARNPLSRWEPIGLPGGQVIPWATAAGKSMWTPPKSASRATLRVEKTHAAKRRRGLRPLA